MSKDVFPQSDASRMERYLLAASSLGKGGTVESLMKGVLEGTQLLASSRVMELATEASIAASTTTKTITTTGVVEHCCDSGLRPL